MRPPPPPCSAMFLVSQYPTSVDPLLANSIYKTTVCRLLPLYFEPHRLFALVDTTWSKYPGRTPPPPLLSRSFFSHCSVSFKSAVATEVSSTIFLPLFGTQLHASNATNSPLPLTPFLSFILPSCLRSPQHLELAIAFLASVWTPQILPSDFSLSTCACFHTLPALRGALALQAFHLALPPSTHHDFLSGRPSSECGPSVEFVRPFRCFPLPLLDDRLPSMGPFAGPSRFFLVTSSDEISPRSSLFFPFSFRGSRKWSFSLSPPPPLMRALIHFA